MRSLIIVAVMAMSSCAPAVADASACYVLADADQRTFCLAKARSHPSMCYAIQSQAVRSQCLAEVR